MLLCSADVHLEYIQGLICTGFSWLCWMAMSFVRIGQEGAILPMRVDPVHRLFVGTAPGIDLFICFVHLSVDDKLY